MCDICGVMWRRSQLERKADGLLYCPDDRDGRDPVTLARLQAERAKETRAPLPPSDGRMYARGYTAISRVETVDEQQDEWILTESGEPILTEDGIPFLVE